MPLKKPTRHREIPKSVEAARTRKSGERAPPVATVARQLEFTPKLVRIIKTATKKIFVKHPYDYGSLSLRITRGHRGKNIGTKAAFPCWEELFKKIQGGYLLHFSTVSGAVRA
jgi:hypothetical protein